MRVSLDRERFGESSAPSGQRPDWVPWRAGEMSGPEIGRLPEMADHDGVVRLAPRPNGAMRPALAPGARVTVVGDPFRGFDAPYVGQTSDDRMQVLIPVLDRQAKSIAPRSRFRAFNPKVRAGCPHDQTLGAMPTIDLTDAELAAVTEVIRRAVEHDRFPRARRPPALSRRKLDPNCAPPAQGGKQTRR
jgi:hypothetical protein